MYEYNTTRGIASVFPYRKQKGRKRDQEDNELRDRHGVPRCKYCGGPTQKVSFTTKSNSGPRLFVKCQTQATPECRGERQTFACKDDWKLLDALVANGPAVPGAARLQLPL